VGGRGTNEMVGTEGIKNVKVLPHCEMSLYINYYFQRLFPNRIHLFIIIQLVTKITQMKSELQFFFENLTNDFRCKADFQHLLIQKDTKYPVSPQYLLGILKEHGKLLHTSILTFS
jgi:hypothetical protein